MSSSEYGICPYDPSHRIILFRMPKHIVKCMQNYRGPPLVTCKFNATHRVRPDEMTAHLETCAAFHKIKEAVGNYQEQ